MIKSILYGILISGFLLNNTYAGSSGIVYSPNKKATNVIKEQIVVREKVVQFGDNIRIIGIPVAETDAEYYFRKSREGCPPTLSDNDMKKIAEYLAAELLKNGYGGNLPFPGAPKISEAEAKFTVLVNNKCAICHSGDNPKDGLSFIKDGKLNLQDTNGKLNTEEIVGLMFDSVLYQRMPKTGTKLTDEETVIVRDYNSELINNKRNRVETSKPVNSGEK